MPDAVTGLDVTPVLPTRIDLSWDPPVGADLYRIQRAEGPKEEVVDEDFATIVGEGESLTATSWSDTTVEPGKTYSYRVAAGDEP